MVARHGAGMRITNEASDYATNFAITRHVGSACLQYGTYFGYEPAGGVDENGIVARVYNAAASGAWELFHYDNPPQGPRGERYKQNLQHLHMREPVVEVAVFWPRTSVDLQRSDDLGAVIRSARDRCDIDLVDELMISDGALDNLRLLVWGAGPFTEGETAERIRAAVRQGMTLLVPAGWQPESPEGERIFPSEQTAGERPFRSYSIPYVPDEKPDSGAWREGEFYGAEPDSHWRTTGHVCWTGGTVTLHVPLPDEPCRVRIPYWVGHVPEPTRIIVNGELLEEVGADRVGEASITPEVGSRELTVTFESGTWSPAETGESSDTRKLSVMLRDVVVEPLDAEGAPADPVANVVPVGKGYVVEAMGQGAGALCEALSAVIKRPADYGVPSLSPWAAVDGVADQLYLAVTTEDALLYNHGDTDRTVETPAGPVEVPAHTIISVPR